MPTYTTPLRDLRFVYQELLDPSVVLGLPGCDEVTPDLVAAIQPRFMRVNADFNVRGGVYTRVVAEHRAEGWQAPAVVELP